MIDDLDIYFNDFGVDCSSNNQDGAFNFKGIFECPDGLFASDMIISTKNSVLVKTSVANQFVGESIIVDAVSYKIRNRSKIDDGKITRVELGK